LNVDDSRPFLIPATSHEKVWGRMRDGIKLGEIWAPAPPLLLKFIFSSEKLSVQVHPGDDYARAHENSLGKTECWIILDAEPGARLAVGLKREMSSDELRAAIQGKTIEDDLGWIEVERGDFIFVPWGTVHAIGAGVTLCEVQEDSDITYRLYDYGRPREMHLEKGLKVIRHHPAAGKLSPVRLESGRQCHDFLVACRHFAIERFTVVGGERHDRVDPSRSEVLIFLDGEGEIVAGGECCPYRSEQMWRLPETMGEYRIVPSRETTWLKTYVPAGLDAVRYALERAGVSQRERNRIVIEDV
jgi:mannose-6-phosphate isomerase